VSRWIAACAIDATLFLSYLALTDARVRDVLRAWATGPRPFLWLSYHRPLRRYRHPPRRASLRTVDRPLILAISFHNPAYQS
jgi:hypothetical protein